MPDQHDRREVKGLNGWLIIGGIAGMAGFAKLLIFIVAQIGNAGPSGAYAMGAIGLMACGAFAAVALGPIGRAIGKRLLQGGASAAASDEDVQDLRLQVAELRQALAESQERIDFAERMLTAGKEAAQQVER